MRILAWIPKKSSLTLFALQLSSSLSSRLAFAKSNQGCLGDIQCLLVSREAAAKKRQENQSSPYPPMTEDCSTGTDVRSSATSK